jgi:TolA-binding protein
MSNGTKIALYVALALLASVSGFFALTRFKSVMNADRFKDVETERPDARPEESSGTNENQTPVLQTNTVTPSTNSAGTNSISVAELSTNAPTGTLPNAETNGATAATSTNKVAPKTAVENGKPGTGPVSTALGGGSTIGPKQARGPKGGRMGAWMALFVLSIIGLGLMIALDVSHFFGNRALKVIYNDDLEGMSKAEYEKAEEVWTSGQPLEAIRMMREYLNKNPREQHVALRIAAIYEKDLGNFLAAALEYEEVLKHKLPADRWGWAAIHLCNLYFKLGQEQKAFALLRRLVNEYPDTPAADKARKRLEQVEAMMAPEAMTEQQVETHPEPISKKPAEKEPPSNLPPGFRPKKG